MQKVIEEGNKNFNLYLNSSRTFDSNRLSLPAPIPSSSTVFPRQVQNDEIVIESDESCNTSSYLPIVSDLESETFASNDDSSFDDDDDLNEVEISLKHRKLFLLLFLNQSHRNLCDSDVVIDARIHSLVHEDEDIPLSYETLKKRAKIFQPKVDKYIYTNCGLTGPLNAAQITSDETVFCGRTCNCKITPSAHMDSYFCYIQLQEYLKYILPKIIEFLRFNSSLPTDQPSEIIRDIVDGLKYRQLGGLDTIVIYFGFDGVQYCEKSKKSIWPLMIYICELPFNLRQKFAFPLAIHSGNKQPSNVMLEPFINELLTYFREPIEIVLKNGSTRKFFVKLLLGICDAPARAKVLEMKQHNGYYGCNYCKTLVTPHEDIKCMIYPMNVDHELRTDQEWRSLAEKACHTRITKSNEHEFYGIKGKSPFLELPYIDIVSFCPPEFMHSQFLGTVLLLLEFFSGRRSTEAVLDFDILNQRLKTLKFPSKLLRVMPDITKPLKSIDLENLLYYGFIFFEGLLPDAEFANLQLLSLIISTLSSRKITSAQIDQCEQWIQEFISDFGKLYPTELHKYNVHMLCHLPQVVRLFGPLIVCSSYQVSWKIYLF